VSLPNAVYAVEVFNAIKDVPGKGRPKKAVEPKPKSKKAKTEAKSKKPKK